jgi:hypothetical protein
VTHNANNRGRGKAATPEQVEIKKENLRISLEDVIESWFKHGGEDLHFDLDVKDIGGLDLVVSVDVERK